MCQLLEKNRKDKDTDNLVELSCGFFAVSKLARNALSRSASACLIISSYGLIDSARITVVGCCCG